MKDINDSNITQTVEIVKNLYRSLDVQVQSLLNIYTINQKLLGLPLFKVGGTYYFGLLPGLGQIII